jgi:hypothetical protein
MMKAVLRNSPSQPAPPFIFFPHKLSKIEKVSDVVESESSRRMLEIISSR